MMSCHPPSQRAIVVSTDHGLSVRILEFGTEGLPCILIHGFGEAACVWADFAAATADRLRTIAVDLRGHGDSDWGPEGAYDIETLTSDVRKVVRSLNIDRLLLMGHSLGGDIAL